MSENKFSSFTNAFGGAESAKETQDLENQSGSTEYVEVPHGTYEVKVTKLELTVGKTSGKLMATCWFRIVSGEYKGSSIFKYQLVEKPFGRKLENEFLRSLESGVEVAFDGDFDNYNALHEQVFNAIKDAYEYQLNYRANEKNAEYSDYIIEKRFDAALPY